MLDSQIFHQILHFPLEMFVKFSPSLKIIQFVSNWPRVHTVLVENWAIENPKFEVAVHDLHFRRIWWGRKLWIRFVYEEEGIGSGCLNPFLMMLRRMMRGEGWSMSSSSSSSSSLRSHTSPVVVVVVVVVSSDIDAAREEKKEPTMFCATMDNYLLLKSPGRWLRHATLLHNFCPLLFY